jgi:hypothetical protein
MLARRTDHFTSAYEAAPGRVRRDVDKRKQLTDKPIPEATATAAELRAIQRGRAQAVAGEAIPYDQYRAQLRARLKAGAINRAQRDREVAAEWDPIADEVWRRDDRRLREATAGTNHLQSKSAAVWVPSGSDLPLRGTRF